jgi:hypothetical protein
VQIAGGTHYPRNQRRDAGLSGAVASSATRCHPVPLKVEPYEAVMIKAKVPGIRAAWGT